MSIFLLQNVAQIRPELDFRSSYTVNCNVLNSFVFSQPDDFLGQASVIVDDLRRLPSSRQIIPLTGRPRTSTSTSGSVTVEVSSICCILYHNQKLQISKVLLQVQLPETSERRLSGLLFTFKF